MAARHSPASVSFLSVGNVTKYVPHQAVKLIAAEKVDFR